MNTLIAGLLLCVLTSVYVVRSMYLGRLNPCCLKKIQITAEMGTGIMGQDCLKHSQYLMYIIQYLSIISNNIKFLVFHLI